MRVFMWLFSSPAPPNRSENPYGNPSQTVCGNFRKPPQHACRWACRSATSRVVVTSARRNYEDLGCPQCPVTVRSRSGHGPVTDNLWTSDAVAGPPPEGGQHPPRWGGLATLPTVASRSANDRPKSSNSDELTLATAWQRIGHRSGRGEP